MKRRHPPGDSWIARFGDTLRSLFSASGSGPGDDSRTAQFRLLYERFREILAANDSTLELIADIEESLGADAPVSIDAFAERVRSAALHAFVMVKNLNLIDHGRHTELYESLKRINAAIEAELPPVDETIDGPLVLGFEEMGAQHEGLVGPKMLNLSRVRNELGLPVPDGFAVTAAAYSRLMTAAGLWGSVVRLGDLRTAHGQRALTAACSEVAAAMARTPVPEPVAHAISHALEGLGARAPLVAVRSATLGEDKLASHAGQYQSLLNVPQAGVLDAYKRVVSSVFSPSAVAYRAEHGVVSREAWMAVGVMAMVLPRCAGIMFSRDFEDMEADRVVVAATPGLAAEVASGTQSAWEVVLEFGTTESQLPPWLDPSVLSTLWDYARRIEALFGTPQDIEWAQAKSGEVFVIQARPMRVARARSEPRLSVPQGLQPLLTGGRTACRGVVAGPVHVAKDDDALDAMPSGAVLVAHHSSPALSRVMGSCGAIVTEVGSPAGHMAILSREAGVPTIVGVRGALDVLKSGMWVTVDATTGSVYEGALDAPLWKPARPALGASPSHQALRRVAALVTPLSLVDPASASFSAESCKSLHDILRYVHERAFATMFHFGDRAESDRKNAVVLEARLPFEVLLYDVGGGVVEAAAEAKVVRPEMIASAPLIAFLAGMLDPRLRWDRPRPVSASGFLSVLGESMIGPPAEAQQLGRVSYVVCADRYMNFSTKAGYHFSTVDTWCGDSINKNYIHFRFSGGGAAGDRRARRIECLALILSRLDFRIQQRGDMLVARMAKYERETMVHRLSDLGQLTICARQLDMLMDSDSSPAFFAAAFLDGDLAKFF